MESSRERWNCIPKVVSPKSNFPARGWKSCWSHTLTATSPSAPGRQKSKQRLLKHVVSRLCSLSESCPKPWYIVDLLEYSVMYIYVNTGIWYMYIDKPVGAGVPGVSCFFLYIYRFTYLKWFLLGLFSQPSAAKASPTFLFGMWKRISENQRGQGAAKYIYI